MTGADAVAASAQIASTQIASVQWNFVAAAYGLTAVLTLAVLVWAWRAMVRAEQRAEQMRGDRTP